MNDIDRFLEYYAQGKLFDAVHGLLTSPTQCYDDFQSKKRQERKESQYILNYADALAYGDSLSKRMTSQHLLKEDYGLSEECLDQLRYDNTLFWLYALNQREFKIAIDQDSKDPKHPIDPALSLYITLQKQDALLDAEDLDSLKALATTERRKTFLQQTLWTQSILRLQHQNPALHNIFKSKPGNIFLPYVPLRFASAGTSLPPSPQISSFDNKLPLLFMEPYDLDWKALLDPLKATPALFLFLDYPQLCHCLQFEEVLQSLLEPNHTIYLLNVYPNEQLRLQPAFDDFPAELLPIHISQRPHLLDRTPLLLQWLAKAIAQSNEEKQHETPTGNALYRLGDNHHDTCRIAQLGKSRTLAFSRFRQERLWADPHKGNSLPDADIGSPPPDHLPAILDTYQSNKPKRSIQTTRTTDSTEKLRLAHIVPQVIDGGHAPSRLLRTLFEHHNRNRDRDRDRYQLFLLITERLIPRSGEYPCAIYYSVSSSTRGARSLQSIKQSGAEIYIDNARIDYLDTAQGIANILSHNEIDIAIFHGPDVINSLATRITDVPLRVLFDHGSLPPYGGFDLIIASSDDAMKKDEAFYKPLGTEITALPYVVDSRETWQSGPFPKSYFRLPENAQILTTISLKLDARISKEMQHAIAEILTRCPNAYYLPIGPLIEPDAFVRQFESLGVAGRVCPIGQRPNPSQLARSMDLYLNEFPFGSGLAILDAMASGCPVVSMHDKKGPPQARFGAIYCGIDRVITSGDPKDYVELACQLLTDKEMYKEWSKEALERYEERTNVEHYVAQFERIIEKHITQYTT